MTWTLPFICYPGGPTGKAVGLLGALYAPFLPGMEQDLPAACASGAGALHAQMAGNPWPPRSGAGVILGAACHCGSAANMYFSDEEKGHRGKSNCNLLFIC